MILPPHLLSWWHKRWLGMFRSFLNREENFFYFLGRFVIAGKEARENIQIVIHWSRDTLTYSKRQDGNGKQIISPLFPCPGIFLCQKFCGFIFVFQYFCGWQLIRRPVMSPEMTPFVRSAIPGRPCESPTLPTTVSHCHTVSPTLPTTNQAKAGFSGVFQCFSISGHFLGCLCVPSFSCLQLCSEQQIIWRW